MLDDIRPIRPQKASGAAEAPVLQPLDIPANKPAAAPTPSDLTNEAGFIGDGKAAARNDKKFKLKLPNISKKQGIIIGVVAALLIGGGVAAFMLTRKDSAPVQQAVEAPAPPPPPPPKTTEPSRLTGIEIPIEENKTPVTGIMIENSPDARPQAGLKDAGVVIEMLVEGGITRFLALFQESKPDHVGPVRSLRPPYIDFVMAFDAAIAHAGGSGEALAQVQSLGLKDLDHGPNGGAFRRSPQRYAPHNLYTSLGQMIDLQKQKGFSSTFTPLIRKAETPSPAPTAKSVDINVSAFLYNSHWDYDATSNSYARTMAGRPHTDERSGEQIKSKAVVALVMSHHYAGIYSVYGTTGSGKAYVFQDGNVTEATWTRPERKSQVVLTDVAGQPLGLNPGQTWMTLVTAPDRVTFAP